MSRFYCNPRAIVYSVIIAGASLSAPLAAMADDIARGKEIYNGLGACASCHGVEGKGDGAAAAAMNPKPSDFTAGVYKFDTDGDGKTGSETDIFDVISNGAMKYSGSPMMSARADIPEADRKSLAKFIISLKK
ncbi:MAG: cytochrome c [Deltaproteobacteria bacterium]|nr:cytochrome c [Deltaproteobacteria bacterium]